MGTLQHRVIAALKAELDENVIDGLETVSSTGRVTGWVASDAFDGLDDHARQEKIWSTLEAHLGQDDLKHLGPIVTLNLKEASFDLSPDG